MHSEKKTRVFLITLIALFVSFLLAGFVLAQVNPDDPYGTRSGSTGSGADPAKLFEPIKNMFANWTQGQLDVNIAKYLFWLIVGILFFSLIEVVPVVKGVHISLKIILSVVISFLSIAYLLHGDIYTMLAGYGALGAVLGGILPFLFIAFLSKKINDESRDNVYGLWLEKFILFAFIVFLFYKVINFMLLGKIQTAGGVIYLAVLGLAILYFFLQKKILAWLFKEEIKAQAQSTARELSAIEVARLNESIRRLEDDKRALLEAGNAKQSAIDSLNDRIERLREYLVDIS